MSKSSSAPPPEEFAAAVRSLEGIRSRPELVITGIPAPERLAPYALAFAADVRPAGARGHHADDSGSGTGRFVVLYDPDGQEGWNGRFRIVCFAQAPLETEIGVDPFLADVAWSWLVDALDARGAKYTSASGTATKILSTGYGELAAQGDGAQIELRASWSPTEADLSAHVAGWGELVCMLAGLPPSGDAVPLVPGGRHA